MYESARKQLLVLLCPLTIDRAALLARICGRGLSRLGIGGGFAAVCGADALLDSVVGTTKGG